MRSVVRRCAIVAVASTLLVVAVVFSRTRAQERTPAQAAENRVNLPQLDKWMQELSNAGRWGKDDVLGAVNTITPEKRRQAAALVRTGESVSLSHELITGGPESPFQVPFVLKMKLFPERQVTRDQQDIDPHGGSFTHIDALCHMAYKGHFYNNFAWDTATAQGCKLGINAHQDGIVTRGVLSDIPRLRNLPYLEAGTHVYREDIEAWEKQAGVKVAPGDALLLRTGRWAKRPSPGSGGYDAWFLPFLKD